MVAACVMDKEPSEARSTTREADAVFWLGVSDIPTVPATGATFGGEVADFCVAGDSFAQPLHEGPEDAVAQADANNA